MPVLNQCPALNPTAPTQLPPVARPRSAISPAVASAADIKRSLSKEKNLDVHESTEDEEDSSDEEEASKEKGKSSKEEKVEVSFRDPKNIIL